MSKTYKTAEACRVLDVQPYVLRYWETEFTALGGKKPGPQRTYSTAEVAILKRIKQLLYDEGYTIAGAKKRLDADAEEAGEEAGDGGKSSKAKATTSKAAAKTTGKPVKAAKAQQKPKANKKRKAKKGSGQASLQATDSDLDSQDVQSIESLLPELRRLHGEAIDLLALVRGD